MSNTMINEILNEYSVSYTADGINNKFYHPFAGVYMDQVQVFVNSVLKDQWDKRDGYSLTINSAVTGGFITFTNIPLAGSKILICENVTFQRVVNFFASSNFTAKDLNVEFNNIYKILGILNANSIKTLRINNSDSVQDIADLQDGLIIKQGDNVITKNFDIDTINKKLDDISHKYDDIKVALIQAFNKISSQPASGGGNVIKNALVSQNNLNDVLDIKQARKNLGLGDIATLPKITSSNIDDTILKQNLENISDPALARQKLGLGDMVTMTKTELINLIDSKINNGFDIPVISASASSDNKDYTTDINLLQDQYQQIQIATSYTSSYDDVLYITDDMYELHIETLGTYSINGFLSIHGAYNMVAMLEVRKATDGTLVTNFISNHINSNANYTSPGVCIFNELCSVTEPLVLRLFVMGDNSKDKNLMLDNPLDTDYFSKITIQRIIN